MIRMPLTSNSVGRMRRHPRRILAAVGAIILFTAGCKPQPPSSDAKTNMDQAHAAPRPNIIWLSVESVRADHLGCYGYARDTTPQLDRLAAESTVYERANSVTSWTLTAHASMFTGLYPTAHRVTQPKDRLADDYTTVAEVLAESGYQTAAVVAGPYLSRAHNLQQGFTYVDQSPIQHMKGASADITNPDMERAMFNYLRRHRATDRPFMLFAYYWDTHSEYIPPAPFDTMFVPADAKPIKNVQFMPAFKLGRHISPAQLKYLVAQYDGELRCTDGYIGRMFDLLRELELWENTAIIVTADHGEEFYENGRNSHKNTVYVESVRVPLIIKWPGSNPARRDDRLVSLVDLFPTVLELAGCTDPLPHSGHSLLAPPPNDRAIFFELETLWSYRKRSTKEKWLERTGWFTISNGRYKLHQIIPREDREGIELRER
jgi:arylsulfatase A-like enzyme